MKTPFASLTARLRRNAPAAPAVIEVPPESEGSGLVALSTEGAPMTLLIGSISGCSAKDADAFARGLADPILKAPGMGTIRVFEDKPRGRFIYEVHEGGPGFSIVEKVLESLAAGDSVRIALTNGRHILIEEAHGDIISLIYPPQAEEVTAGDSAKSADQAIQPIQAYTGTRKLAPLIQERKTLVPIGSLVLGVASSVFLLTGIAYVALKADLFEGDFLISQVKAGYIAQYSDNPVNHLEKARNAAEREGKAIHKLQKTAKGWSYELK